VCWCLQYHVTNAELEKRQKQAEKLCVEWQHKAGDLQTTLDRTQNDVQSTAQDLIYARTQVDEIRDQLNAVKRENKTTSSTCFQRFDEFRIIRFIC